MNLLITGANGFLGSHLCNYFSTLENYNIFAQTRVQLNGLSNNTQTIKFDLNDDLDSIDLSKVDVIIHCAGRAHVMKETSTNPLEIYRKVNVQGTINLAKKAIKNGVKRFIYLSSIKVNGDETTAQKPFTPNDSINTIDPYGLSKYEAELALLELAKDSNIEIVIIRPVLIYGENVKANFQSMVKLSAKNIPLPVGCLDNKRSMVSLYNLTDFIHVCLSHPAAKNEVFLVSDQDDITVKQLFAELAQLQDKTFIALPVPKFLINILAAIVGKSALASRLCSSLLVDTSKNTNLLGWKAPYTVQQSLKIMFKK